MHPERRSFRLGWFITTRHASPNEMGGAWLVCDSCGYLLPVPCAAELAWSSTTVALQVVQACNICR
jgi:hypothetical protein